MVREGDGVDATGARQDVFVQVVLVLGGKRTRLASELEESVRFAMFVTSVSAELVEAVKRQMADDAQTLHVTVMQRNVHQTHVVISEHITAFLAR